MTAQIKPYPFVENVIHMFGDWLNHRRDIREISDMDSNEFARIAHELRIAPTDLDMLVRRGPHAIDELPRLLTVLGVDEAALSRTQPFVLRDMARVCAACQQKVRCNDDLDVGTSVQHYGEYCPNATTITALGHTP